MKKNVVTTLLAVALCAPIALALGAQDSDKPVEAGASKVDKTDEQIIEEQLPSYPAGPCLISGEEMGGDMGEPINFVYEGRLFRMCCKMCKKMLLKTPEEYVAALNAAVIAEQSPGYPLEACPISGEKLGGMGEPVDYLYGTHLVRLCCKGCVRGIKKDPTAALEKIAVAAAAK